jgi:hypothetical protein
MEVYFYLDGGHKNVRSMVYNGALLNIIRIQEVAVLLLEQKQILIGLAIQVVHTLMMIVAAVIPGAHIPTMIGAGILFALMQYQVYRYLQAMTKGSDTLLNFLSDETGDDLDWVHDTSYCQGMILDNTLGHHVPSKDC